LLLFFGGAKESKESLANSGCRMPDA